jgi:hypothetical protein
MKRFGGGLVSEHVVSELPCDSDDGKIVAMGRHSIRSQTADLFSVGPSSPEQISEAEAALPRRVALPKDLPRAVPYLDERQLDLLLKAAIDESRTRGRSPVNRDAVPPATDAGSPRKRVSPPAKQSRHQNIKSAAGSTQGRVNGVRAAFRAGVTPARIAPEAAFRPVRKLHRVPLGGSNHMSKRNTSSDDTDPGFAKETPLRSRQ